MDREIHPLTQRVSQGRGPRVALSTHRCISLPLPTVLFVLTLTNWALKKLYSMNLCRYRHFVLSLIFPTWFDSVHWGKEKITHKSNSKRYTILLTLWITKMIRIILKIYYVRRLEILDFFHFKLHICYLLIIIGKKWIKYSCYSCYCSPNQEY